MSCCSDPFSKITTGILDVVGNFTGSRWALGKAYCPFYHLILSIIHILGHVIRERVIAHPFHTSGQQLGGGGASLPGGMAVRESRLALAVLHASPCHLLPAALKEVTVPILPDGEVSEEAAGGVAAAQLIALLYLGDVVTTLHTDIVLG